MLHTPATPDPLYTRAGSNHGCSGVTQGGRTPVTPHPQTRTRHTSSPTDTQAYPLPARAIGRDNATPPRPTCSRRTDRQTDTLSLPHHYSGGRHSPPQSCPCRPRPADASPHAQHPIRTATVHARPYPAYPRPPSADATPASAATLPSGLRRRPARRPAPRPLQTARPALAPRGGRPPAPPPARPASPRRRSPPWAPSSRTSPLTPGGSGGGGSSSGPGRAGPQAHHGRGTAARPVVLATRSPEEGARCNACARAAAAAAGAWGGTGPPPVHVTGTAPARWGRAAPPRPPLPAPPSRLRWHPAGRGGHGR